MDARFINKRLITATKVNSFGVVRMSDMLAMLQDITLQGMSDLGYGSERTFDKGRLWVIGNQCMEINRLPVFEEEITIETWFGKTSHMLYPCYHMITSADGELLLKVGVLWTLMDANSRTMLTAEECDFKVVAEKTGDEINLNRGPRALPVQFSRDFAVPFSYLDNNAHMNNVKYFDLIADTLSQFWDGLVPKQVSARYIGEAKVCDVMKVRWGSQDNKVYLETEVDGRVNFKAELQY